LPAFELSPRQLRFVRTFGYLHLRGLLRASIAEIDRAFERVLREHGGDAYAGEHRHTVSPGINGDGDLCRAILDAEPIDGALTTVLGGDWQYWNSELSYCAGDTPWHSDSPWPEERRTPGWYELLVYLDPLAADSGALRVIPGSHRCGDGYAEEIHRGIIDESETTPARPADSWGVAGREVPAVALPSQPGDVVLLNHMTAHASFGGAPRRRLLTAVFFPRLAGADVEQLRSANRARGHTRSRLFGDGAAILRSAPPRRMAHLEQLLEHTPDDGPALRELFESAPRGR
jgi:hypothetical protein